MERSSVRVSDSGTSVDGGESRGEEQELQTDTEPSQPPQLPTPPPPGQLLSSQWISTLVGPPNPKESFPARLHRMLADIELLGERDPRMKKLRDYVSWLDHGKSFRIHQKKKFEEVVMPVWFNRLKCNSFLRQLSLYGFVRNHQKGAEKGAWYHKYFLRDQPELAVQIERMDKKKSKASALPASNAATQAAAAATISGRQESSSASKGLIQTYQSKPEAAAATRDQSSGTSSAPWQDSPESLAEQNYLAHLTGDLVKGHRYPAGNDIDSQDFKLDSSSSMELRPTAASTPQHATLTEQALVPAQPPYQISNSNSDNASSGLYSSTSVGGGFGLLGQLEPNPIQQKEAAPDLSQQLLNLHSQRLPVGASFMHESFDPQVGNAALPRNSIGNNYQGEHNLQLLQQHHHHQQQQQQQFTSQDPYHLDIEPLRVFKSSSGRPSPNASSDCNLKSTADSEESKGDQQLLQVHPNSDLLNPSFLSKFGH